MGDTVVYLRSGSPEIRWERVAKASRMPPTMVAGIPTCPAAAPAHASSGQRDPGDVSRVMAADSGTRYRYR
jgi:hypothetical protein